ncbi:MAG: tetratricopeptide repeat protein [Chitinispirillaceae bacterium]|nr:tetratricopeptide repeat protein [Chitinispirillaceae bacterium]
MKAPPKIVFPALTGLGIAGIVTVWLSLVHPGADTLLTLFGKSAPTADCTIIYPENATVFPPEIPPPTIRWRDASSTADSWLVSLRFNGTGNNLNSFTERQQWKPTDQQWETIKQLSRKYPATLAVIGLRGSIHRKVVSGDEISFSTSEDSVGNPLFYREVILPFSEAVRDPSQIRWRFGAIHGGSMPPVVLENLPVCGNCHSFSTDGATLGMDVDYANDKGAYTVTEVTREMSLVPEDIITWSDFERDENDPTFGLLSQVSPDGRFVVSTVKDRSVFVAKPDLAFSQLFFPIQGVLAVYSRATGKFAPLPGADDPSLVQSNPSWSPDGNYIVFARSAVYHLKNLHDKGKALLSPEECSEFLTGTTAFKYDLYRIPFNKGKGGRAEPLIGASRNGMSNFFARYSPDGKWIVFCKATSFMLLQPDSRLYIIPADGGEPREMRCNTGLMNSWHSWSSNSRWLVFASKQNTPYTQLFMTHIDTNGNDAPPVLLEHCTAPDRAANIPEFVYTGTDAIRHIREQFIDDVSLWRAGMSFEEAGDFDNALTRYRQALELNPENVKALISAGNILEKRGKTDDALNHYTRAFQLDSSDAIARINIGNIFLNRGNIVAAIGHYTAALHLAPDNGFAQYNLAEAYFKLSKFREARNHFLAALRLMPDDALTRFGLGKTYAREHNLNEAIVQFTEGVRLLPDDPDGYQLLADALISAGKRNIAVSLYRKSRGRFPGNTKVLLQLANLLRQPEEIGEALSLYREALRMEPGLKEAVDSLAVLGEKH